MKRVDSIIPPRLLFLSFAVFLTLGMTTPLIACDEQKISTGQTMGEVELECGKPTWKEKETGAAIRKKGQRKHSGGFEAWYYNLGPQQFIRILHFQHGRLEQIKTGSYGWTEGGAVDFGCAHTPLSNGVSKMEVKGRCGKPTSIYPRSKGKSNGREEWFYNRGPTEFVQTYRFENGRLAEIKTGGYGK